MNRNTMKFNLKLQLNQSNKQIEVKVNQYSEIQRNSTFELT